MGPNLIVQFNKQSRSRTRKVIIKEIKKKKQEKNKHLKEGLARKEFKMKKVIKE